MTAEPVSHRIASVQNVINPVWNFFVNSTYSARLGDPSICDFVFGNPHQMPLSGFATALSKWSVPQNKDWFAYKDNVPASCQRVAASLQARYGIPFEARDVSMTNGAFAALSVVLTALVNAGDEVVFVSPPWFFYEALITAVDGVPVRVNVNPDTFDLALDAIRAALTERTRAIIVNSPNNPTGKIYPPATLEALAALLSAWSEKIGHTVYLISDEAYSRIIYDGREFPTPTAFYPNSFLLYTYGKTLLTPGQRLGFIAMTPTIAHRDALRDALFAAQICVGYAFPNALLQHALPDLEGLSIDIAHLQHKRDWLVGALQEMGYTVHAPEGTFYLLPRSPLEDDLAFTDLLASHNIFVLPGTIVEMPGYFRISLTANDGMIERALDGFAAAFQEATAEARHSLAQA